MTSFAPGPQVVILADDLTGACDTAQPFAATLPTGVLIRRLEGLEGVAGWQVLSVNGRTRSERPDAARAITREILGRLRGRFPTVIYKKIDSTLRGNVAAEAQAIADAVPDRPVVVAPAFPAMGRTVVDGCVLVRGVPVDRTEYAADPRHPVREASLKTLLGGGRSGGAEVIPLALVRAGEASLAVALAAARARARFLCLDAETDEDLDAIARAAGSLGPPDVLVGSAGLAAALARTRRRPERGAGNASATGRPAGPSLAVIGTRNPATERQVEWIRRQGLAAVISVAPDHFLEDRGALQACILRVHARAALDVRQDVVLHVSGGFVPELSASHLLADLVECLPRARVGCLVLSGGGTADAVLHRLGAWGIRLLPGPTPAGCSLGAICGGRYDGACVVLKAGGFGTESLLARILDPRRA